MKQLIITILCALSLTASAQYRYQTYTLPSSSTNTTIQTNTLATYNSSAAVSSSTRADIRLAFKLTSATTNAMGTNAFQNVTCTFDKSVDGTYWTNSFTFSVRANSNSVVWDQTNIDVSTAAWLRLVSITNGNAGKVTNVSVFVGAKTGL